MSDDSLRPAITALTAKVFVQGSRTEAGYTATQGGFPGGGVLAT
jgi:hypothetical protein